MPKMDEALLQGFISRRLTPDVQDRLDIEDDLAALEAEIKVLECKPLQARLQAEKLRQMHHRHGYLTTAHRVSVEVVRDSPVKSGIYREEQEQRREAAARDAPPSPPSADPPVAPSAKERWLSSRRLLKERKKELSIADDEDDD